MSDRVYDVVVVGAGLSGLWCGYQLKYTHNTQNILILEARDRVGGRTCAKPVPQHIFQALNIPIPQKEVLVDVGGQWVGPQQVRVNKLIEQLHLRTISQHYMSV
jgi:monoamine oxidase